MSKKYYVTMTDKVLSNWYGTPTQGKWNKLVFTCNSLDEARIVINNAENRTDMKYINLCYTKPYYNKATHYTQYVDKKEYPCFYEQGYFRKG